VSVSPSSCISLHSAVMPLWKKKKFRPLVADDCPADTLVDCVARSEALPNVFLKQRAVLDTGQPDAFLERVAAQDRDFFADLIVPVDGITKDHFPRRDTSVEKLAKLKPVFDRSSGRGTLTAGNSSPLTDGAAAIWVATEEGLDPSRPATALDGRCRFMRSRSMRRSWQRSPMSA
jgi:hypothetical protein